MMHQDKFQVGPKVYKKPCKELSPDKIKNPVIAKLQSIVS